MVLNCSTKKATLPKHLLLSVDTQPHSVINRALFSYFWIKVKWQWWSHLLFTNESRWFWGFLRVDAIILSTFWFAQLTYFRKSNWIVNCATGSKSDIKHVDNTLSDFTCFKSRHRCGHNQNQQFQFFSLLLNDYSSWSGMPSFWFRLKVVVEFKAILSSLRCHRAQLDPQLSATLCEKACCYLLLFVILHLQINKQVLKSILTCFKETFINVLLAMHYCFGIKQSFSVVIFYFSIL